MELQKDIIEEQLSDLLVDMLVINRMNTDGTIERCSPDELLGKDLEVVSIRDFSFQEISNMFIISN